MEKVYTSDRGKKYIIKHRKSDNTPYRIYLTPPNPRALSKDQIIDMIYRADIVDGALISVLYDTGCRIGEILNLKKKDVFKDYVVITHLKKRKDEPPSEVIIGETTYDLLREAMSESPTQKVFNMSYPTARRHIMDVAKKCGIKDFHLHMLRDSRATHLLADGYPITTVAALLGHSSPEMTYKRYLDKRKEIYKDFPTL